jgi:hypothetical protein
MTGGIIDSDSRIQESRIHSEGMAAHVELLFRYVLPDILAEFQFTDVLPCDRRCEGKTLNRNRIEP